MNNPNAETECENHILPDNLVITGIFMLPKGRAYSCRFVRPSASACSSVHMSLFCPEHISKSFEGNLMKLDTLIEGYKENCRMQEP